MTDPRAVPMIWKVFGNGSERMQLVAVELLAQIEGPAASFWLAVLAVEKPSAEVRRQATRALDASRSPRRHRLADQPRPQAVQVRSQAGKRAGLDRRRSSWTESNSTCSVSIVSRTWMCGSCRPWH